MIRYHQILQYLVIKIGAPVLIHLSRPINLNAFAVAENYLRNVISTGPNRKDISFENELFNSWCHSDDELRNAESQTAMIADVCIFEVTIHDEPEYIIL